MAQFLLNLTNISLTTQTGVNVTPAGEDALILYTSDNGTSWVKTTTSYDGVTFQASTFPPFGNGPLDRQCSWNSPVLDGKYIKLKIVPGGCPAGDCNSISTNNEDYDLTIDGTPYDWRDSGKLLTDSESPTGNNLGLFDPADFRETVISGCTSEFGNNYNSEANVDDGSCDFPPWNEATFLIDEYHYNPSTSGQVTYYSTGMNDNDVYSQFFEVYINTNGANVNLRGCTITYQTADDGIESEIFPDVSVIYQFGIPHSGPDSDEEHYSNGGNYTESNMYSYTIGGEVAPNDYYVNGEKRIVFIHHQTFYTEDWLNQFLTQNYSNYSSSEIQLSYSDNGLAAGDNLLPVHASKLNEETDNRLPMTVMGKKWGRFILNDPFGNQIAYLGHYTDGRRPFDWEDLSNDVDVLCDPWPNIEQTTPENTNLGAYNDTCNPEDIRERGYNVNTFSENTEGTKHRIGGSIQLQGDPSQWTSAGGGGINYLHGDNWNASKGVGNPGVKNPTDYIRKVIISEIYFDNPNADEFIEIKNLTDETIDIGDWRIREHNSAAGDTALRISFNFPIGTTIPAGGYIIVARDISNIKFTDLVALTNLFQWGGNSLSSSGEKINLYDTYYNLVDVVDYEYMIQNLVTPGCNSAPCSEAQWNNYGMEINPSLDFTLIDNSGMDGSWANWQVGLKLGGSPGVQGDEPILGCTDSGACNYNAVANTDDGSCEFLTNCSVGCGGYYCPADGFGQNEEDCELPLNCSGLEGTYSECSGTYCVSGTNGTGQNTCVQNLGCGCNNGIPRECSYGSECAPARYCFTISSEGTIASDILGDENTCEGSYNEICGCGGTTPLNCNDFYGTIECAGVNECPSTYCGNSGGPGGSSICCQLDDCEVCGGSGSGSGLYHTCSCPDALGLIQYTCNDESECDIQQDDCGVCGGSNEDYYTSCWDGESDPENCGLPGSNSSCCCGVLSPGECVADPPIQYWSDNDNDGAGDGAGIYSCTNLVPDGYVLNGSDTNGNCNSDVVGTQTSGNYGIDDCGICHYDEYGSISPNYMYFYSFGTIFLTSQDCNGDCPNDDSFYQEPYTELCENYTFGCDLCDVCHGDNSSCSGCMDSTDGVLNFDNEATINCTYKIDPATDDFYEYEFSCCNYQQDCAGEPFQNADGSVNLAYGAQLDDCGVCEGGNLDQDCYGICNGINITDNCGICSCPTEGAELCGGNTHLVNQDQDCAGVCNGDNISDAGGCCLLLERDCAGICDGLAVVDINGDCCPSIGEVDDCDVCNGGNELQDCAGVCSNILSYEVSTYDELSHCCLTSIQFTYWPDDDGDGLGDADANSLILCSNNPYINSYANNNDDLDDNCSTSEGDGSGEVDGCGVCGGANSDRDCAGICFGTTFVDTCGVCDGDNSYCADCAGTPNGDAQIDDCGICIDGDMIFNGDKDCNGVCDGSASLDDCGACTGGNTGFQPNYLQDCSGTCPGAGGAYYGPYGAGLDCAGICGGNHVVDLCDVCLDMDDSSEAASANTSCIGCPDVTSCNGPTHDNPLATTCSWDDIDNIDYSCCLWTDCAGDCTCSNSNSTLGIDCSTTDVCGICNGEGECGGCDKLNAINYDTRLLNPDFATGTADQSCTFGDITILPQSSDGMATDLFLIRVSGNDLRTNGNNVDSASNYNLYGWDSEYFQTERTDGNLFEISDYNLKIKKIVAYGESESADTVLNNNYYNTDLDAWYNTTSGLSLTAITNPTTFIMDNPGSPFWTVEDGDGQYEITITARYCNLNASDSTNGANCNNHSDVNSYPPGTTISITKIIDVINTQPLIQTIDSSYLPRKGIDFRQAETANNTGLGGICDSDEYEQNRYQIKKLNSDKRQMLGMYYYDDNQCHSYKQGNLNDDEKKICDLLLKSKLKNKLDPYSLPLVENPSELQKKYCVTNKCMFDSDWIINDSVTSYVSGGEGTSYASEAAALNWPDWLDGDKLCQMWNWYNGNSASPAEYAWCPDFNDVDFEKNTTQFFSLDAQVLSEQSVYGTRNSYPYEYYDFSCKNLRNYCCTGRFEGYHECVANEFCDTGYSLYAGLPCEETDLSDGLICESDSFKMLSCADDYINYLEMVAPIELSFYFYPREYGCIFETRDSKTDSKFDEPFYYYITNINWGDGSTEDTSNPLITLGKNKVVKHSYDRPGFYKITGDAFRIDDVSKYGKVDFAILNNFIKEYMESADDDDIPSNFNPDCYNNTGDCIDTSVSPKVLTTKTKFWQNFELSILINDDGEVVLGESSPFIEYESTVPVISGISKNSIHYKTISRELGYLENVEKPIDLTFKNTHDKFDSQYALAKMDENKIGPEISAYTGSLYDETRAGSSEVVTEDRDLIFTGQYQDKYEELGSYLGDCDLGQVRLFDNGTITMGQMLGFVNYDLDNSFVLKEGAGAVMFTAPHGQIGLRPTVAVGVNHDYDSYTSAIAEELHNITGAHVLYAVYQQDDPNYYDYIGVDFQDRESETETPAFVGMEGELIPFKRMLRNYLNDHPEIKLVIDIHGAGDYRPQILDIGTAGPFSRDPSGEYVEHEECTQLYTECLIGISDYECIPCKKRKWDGSLELEYSLDDIKNSPAIYAPTLHTDLGLGITSDTNPDGDFILQKIIDFMDNNQIGSGDYGYHDNFDGYEVYEDDTNPPTYDFTKSEGEWLDTENNHACPDTLTDGNGNPIYALDGTEFCQNAGVKKPVTWNRDFTAGRAYTVTRFVGMGAMAKDNYYSNDTALADFVGKVDAIQFEWNWNLRNFDYDHNGDGILDTPTDIRSVKSMVEIHNYVNGFYGHADVITDSLDWSTDWVNFIETNTSEAQIIKQNINNHWGAHKSVGSIPFDYNIATELDNADNPASKRYWKNIIPEDYSIVDRDGINLNLQPNGNFSDSNLSGWKFEIQGVKPQDSTLRKQIQQQQNINHLNINWDVPLTINLQDEPSKFVMQSDYDNWVYWEKPGTYIYTAQVRLNQDTVPFTILPANVPNDPYSTGWSSNGLPTDIWHDVYIQADLTDPYGDVPMKGIFQLETEEVLYAEYQNGFILDFDIRNIQIDFVEPNDEAMERYFDEFGDNVISIDVNSSQRWKPYVSGYAYEEKETIDDEEGIQMDGIFIGESFTEPYYPVLPRFNVFGKFTDLYPYSNKDDNWFLQYTPSDDSELDEEEEGLEINLVPYEITELQGSLHTPFGSPDRIWNTEDTNAPVTNINFSNNAYRYHNYLLIDLDVSQINDGLMDDKGGMGNEGLMNIDYKVKFDKKTRQPIKIKSKSKTITDTKDSPF